MDIIAVDAPDNGSVITCYCEKPIAIGAMLFHDGTQHVPAHFNYHKSGHTSIPIVVADPKLVTPDHAFFGVSIGVPDHNHVAVAISGICTVACSHDDLVDAYLADLVQICPETVDIQCCGVGAGSLHRTFRIKPLKEGDKVDGKRTLGVLLAHGRNPSDEARFQLLPGISCLPQPPSAAKAASVSDDMDGVACPDDDGDAPSASLTLEEDTEEAISSMTIQQLGMVTFRPGEGLGFRAELARFRAMVVESARQYPRAFQTVLNEMSS